MQSALKFVILFGLTAQSFGHGFNNQQGSYSGFPNLQASQEGNRYGRSPYGPGGQSSGSGWSAGSGGGSSGGPSFGQSPVKGSGSYGSSSSSSSSAFTQSQSSGGSYGGQPLVGGSNPGPSSYGSSPSGPKPQGFPSSQPIVEPANVFGPSSYGNGPESFGEPLLGNPSDISPSTYGSGPANPGFGGNNSPSYGSPAGPKNPVKGAPNVGWSGGSPAGGKPGGASYGGANAASSSFGGGSAGCCGSGSQPSDYRKPKSQSPGNSGSYKPQGQPGGLPSAPGGSYGGGKPASPGKPNIFDVSSNGAGPNSPSSYGAGPSSPGSYGGGPSSPGSYGPGPASPSSAGIKKPHGSGSPSSYGGGSSSAGSYGAGPSSPNSYGSGPASPSSHGPGPASPGSYGPGPASPGSYGPGPASPGSYGSGPAAPSAPVIKNPSYGSGSPSYSGSQPGGLGKPSVGNSYGGSSSSSSGYSGSSTGIKGAPLVENGGVFGSSYGGGDSASLGSYDSPVVSNYGSGSGPHSSGSPGSSGGSYGSASGGNPSSGYNNGPQGGGPSSHGGVGGSGKNTPSGFGSGYGGSNGPQKLSVPSTNCGGGSGSGACGGPGSASYGQSSAGSSSGAASYGQGSPSGIKGVGNSGFGGGSGGPAGYGGGQGLGSQGGQSSGSGWSKMIIRIQAFVALVGLASQCRSQILNHERRVIEHPRIASLRNDNELIPYTYGNSISFQYSYNYRPESGFSHGQTNRGSGIVYENAPHVSVGHSIFEGENTNRYGRTSISQPNHIFQNHRRAANNLLEVANSFSGPRSKNSQLSGTYSHSSHTGHGHPHLLRANPGFVYFLSDDENNQGLIQTSHFAQLLRYIPLKSLQGPPQFLQHTSQQPSVHNHIPQATYGNTPATPTLPTQHPSSRSSNHQELIHFPLTVTKRTSPFGALQPHGKKSFLSNDGSTMSNAFGHLYTSGGSGDSSQNHLIRFGNIQASDHPYVASSSSQALIPSQNIFRPEVAKNSQSYTSATGIHETPRQRKSLPRHRISDPKFQTYSIATDGILSGHIPSSSHDGEENIRRISTQ
ncbi:unnamed protein product, partial [Allacma fusca]